jgi:eukaryotic-like serine/threonine-protein kinase
LRPAPARGYHLRRASYLARQGDRDGEQRELAEARRVRDETAFEHYLSGHEQYKRGRWAEAIQDFEAALRLKPDHFWAQCLLAICYFQTTRFEGAKSGLTACIQADPDLAWLYLLRALASGQLAAKYLGLVASSPGREAALRAGADFEFDEAEADFREALARLGSRPDDVLHSIVLHNRGLVRFQRGRLDEAAADYRQALERNKDLYVAHAELAHVAEKRGDLAGAIDRFARAIALKPDSAPLYRGRAAARLGRRDPTPEDRAAALADLDLAIRHEQPDNPVAAMDHTNRGRLLYREQRLDDALRECRLALTILPDDVDAHVLRVQILLKMRRYGDVIRACDAAIAIPRTGRSPLLFELRGLARAAQDDYAGAIRDYNQAIELRPADVRLRARRGWAYLVLDSPRLALDDFDAAIALDQADADAHNGRGTARVRLGDHRAAVADAREALRLDVNDPHVTYNAARIYAMAAPVAASDQGADGRVARVLSSRYQDIAVRLIGDALAREAPEKRESFWRETIQKDPALAAIRRRLKFEELATTGKRPNS